MDNKYSLLATINCPADLKRLSRRELPRLAQELREYIIEVVSQNGGHLASNLGVIELTIALHRVFNSPQDKIIWDVGHQIYAHKILTGRRDNFKSLRQFKGLSGFPKRSESPHDVFETGHASTSISAALGMLCGQGLQGKKSHVVAVIGDGALTGGMAFEALNHAGQLGNRLIIILNDNNMSIGQNVGALSVYMTKLTTTRYYRLFRDTVDKTIQHLPWIGLRLNNYIQRFKRALKAFFFRTNLFADLGYEYVGPLNGHDINSLLHVLTNVLKNFYRPTVIHIATKKGKGYIHAESDPSLFHGVGAFSIGDGKLEPKTDLSFTDAFGQSMVELGKEDQRIVAITAAMKDGTGLDRFAELFPTRFFDVGIAEQHAVTFAAGLATAGLKPVVAIYSTFMQRATDQLIHDVALQNLPVIFALDRAGLVGNDGETHHGNFDLSLFSCVPGLVILSPGNCEELGLMLAYALKLNKPVILRYPRAIPSCGNRDLTLPLALGKGLLLGQASGDVLLISTGSLLGEALKASSLLSSKGVLTSVYHLRFIKPIAEEVFLSLVSRFKLLVYIEDNVVRGGLGEYLARILAQASHFKRQLFIGLPDRFIEHGSRHELLWHCGLDAKGIANQVLATIKDKKEATLKPS